jgi:hypothetical protein
MNDAYKTITVVSSAGSGNVFCQHLISNNLEANIRWVSHNLEKVDKNGINIVFIRNPYDNIASALEITLFEISEEQKEFFINSPARINRRIADTLEEYKKYINYSRHFDYITPITFELLTEDPDKFLKYISEKFEIPYKETRLSAEEVKTKINKMGAPNNRIPREKSDFRKVIDEYVSNNQLVANVYKEYVEYKDIVQSTENI